MDAMQQGQAMELLGSFNDEMTRVYDQVSGTRWAEIEEILVVAAIACGEPVTTRELADMTRVNRRAMSRLIARLTSEGVVQTHRAEHDRRAMAVVFAPEGERRAAALRVAMTRFFADSAELARTVNAGLGGGAQEPREESSEVMDLLRRVCETGVALVRAMPGAASQGQLAARQRAALVLIAGQGAARPRELAAALGVSRPGAAYIVDQLCAKSFIVRRRGVIADRRAVVLEATPAGIHAVGAVMAAIETQRDALADVFGEIARGTW